MKIPLIALAFGLGIASAALAQADKPIHPATPAFTPDKAKEQPKAAKPDVYDEKADARQQIAAALAKAKKENRRVLVQWGGNWCGWCIKLHELYKSDKDIAKKLNYEYDVVYVDAGKDGKNKDLAESYGAKITGYPFLTVLDSDGKVVVHQATDPLETSDKEHPGHDPKKVLDFLTTNQATYLEAQAVLDAGISEAGKTGKRVFLHFGAPWCGWCHKLEDWMARPEIKAIMSKDFVDVKIDTDRMIGGPKVMSTWRGDTKGGIPWFVIVDASGKPLADSGSGEKNIGFPSKPEEIKAFTDMLKKSVQKMTPADIDTLAASLNKVREDDEAKRAK